jgi:hypothetical protein
MGFIQINRKLFDHFLWKENRVFSKAEAWIDLIQLVSYTRNNNSMIGGVKVEWGRGQFPVSYSFLSQRWNWSVSKVRAFLTMLRNSNQINTKTTSVTTILTLCNYDTYNPESQADRQADDKPNDKRTASGRQELNKDNKINKEEDIKENSKKENFSVQQGASEITDFSFLEEPELSK